MKHVLGIVFFFVPFFSWAQTLDDAVLFGQDQRQGNARFMAMSGAFGALGGNSSANTINAASIAVMRQGEFSITYGVGVNGFTTDHYGTSSDAAQTRSRLTNVSIGFSNEPDSRDWNRFNLSLGYNRRNTFDYQYNATGINREGSKLDLYLSDITNSDVFVEDIYEFFPFGAGLAWEALLIDTINGDYYHTLESYGHRQSVSTTVNGGIGDYYVGIGGNFEDKLYIGATLGLSSLNYRLVSTYEETPLDDNTLTYVDQWREETLLEINGRGLNLRLGMIYWFQEKLRMGLAFNSGTSFNLTENYKKELSASWTDRTPTYSSSPDGFNKYTYRSPTSIVASIAWVDKYVGALDFDLELVTYDRLQFETESGYPIDFSSVNQELDDQARTNINMRLGGELLLGHFILRGGGALMGNPVHSGDFFNRYSLSGGLGYRIKRMSFDLAYVWWQQSQRDIPIYFDEGLLLQPTNAQYQSHTVALSCTFKFSGLYD